MQDIIQRDYVNRLAEEYNNLSDMANQMHNLSGSSLTVPPLGRIITLENAIERADKSKSDCTNQWRTGRAPGRQDQLANKKWLKNVNKMILSTNGLQPERELVGIETTAYYLD